jgi:hypothetical protein
MTIMARLAKDSGRSGDQGFLDATPMPRRDGC